MDTSLEVVQELPPLLRVYKDGHVERLVGSKLVPPTPFNNSKTSVSSKDITISLNPEIQARIYLPNHHHHHHQNPSLINDHPAANKLPLLLYFPGGGFCYESAFSSDNHRYLNHIVSTSNVVAVSVNYRRAPEHPLPCAYEDCWSALQWVLTHKTANGSHSSTSGGDPQLEPWLVKYVNFDRIFMGGDSAGANIVHNIAMRIGAEKLPKVIRGVFLCHPYFLGSDLIGSEPFKDPVVMDLVRRMWLFVNPTAVNGFDDPRINPIGPGAPSLSGLGCHRVLVLLAGKDPLVERGKAYVDALKKSDQWEGEVELFENEEEGHVFHIFDPECANAHSLINRLASFLNSN